MEDFAPIFDGVEDPRTSNATRHNLHEMLMIALPCVTCGGQTCIDMEPFGRSKEQFLHRFMTLEHGIPSHDAFSALFGVLDPDCLGRAPLRLAADWPSGSVRTWSRSTARSCSAPSRTPRSARRCTWSTPSPQARA